MWRFQYKYSLWRKTKDEELWWFEPEVWSIKYVNKDGDWVPAKLTVGDMSDYKLQFIPITKAQALIYILKPEGANDWNIDEIQKC